MPAHRQEQRGIGVGDDLHPLGAHGLVGGGALRVDRHELHAGIADRLPARIHLVVGHGVFDAVVLPRVATHEHEDLGVVADHFPGRLRRIHLHVADDVRQADLRGAAGVVAGGHAVAADEAEQPPLQHLRAQHAGVRPAAVGRAEHGVVAVLLDGAQAGVGHQGECIFPGHAHEGFLAAQVRLDVAARIGEIGAAHHRVLHAGGMVGAAEHTFEQHLRRHGVEARKRLHADQHAILHHRLEGTVVRGMRDQHGVGGEHLVEAEKLETARGDGDGGGGLEEGAAAERHDGSPGFGRRPKRPAVLHGFHHPCRALTEAGELLTAFASSLTALTSTRRLVTEPRRMQVPHHPLHGLRAQTS